MDTKVSLPFSRSGSPRLIALSLVLIDGNSQDQCCVVTSETKLPECKQLSLDI